MTIIYIVGFFLGFCMVWFKDHQPFTTMWKYFSWFLMVFFGTLLLNNIKNTLKDFLK